MEGTVASVPRRAVASIPSRNSCRFDTTNILFICGRCLCRPRQDHLRPRREDLDRLRCQGSRSRRASRRPCAARSRNGRSRQVRSDPGIHRPSGRFWQTLEDLDEDCADPDPDEPKNALVKQYQRLFEMEDVELTFHEDALREIAKARHRAQDRRPGPSFDHGKDPARHDVSNCRRWMAFRKW